jgi:hypothetical protein
MEFPKDFNLKTGNILKLGGLALVAIVLIALAFKMIGSSLNYSSQSGGIGGSMRGEMFATDALNESVGASYQKADMDLSIRNVMPTTVPSRGNTAVGDNSEALEVTEHSVNIETRQLKETCSKVSALKVRTDVIFEDANEYKRGCDYSFKAKRSSVAEVLAVLKKLNPKELNENTYTIKNLVDDYTSETEILEKKKAAIEATLASAVKAYDDITALAAQTKDADSLARIIDSKIGIIERLTQQRIETSAQLERLGRSKAEQLDRLDYIYFNVHVVENKFIDSEDLKDSWKAAIKSFVRDINSIMQDLTINLVTLLFFVLQYVAYFFIVLVIAKYVWRLAKRIWTK